MSSRLAEIKQLQSRLSAAQTAITQAQTRRESAVERQQEIEAKMASMGVTPENAREKMAQLAEKFDSTIKQYVAEMEKVEL